MGVIGRLTLLAVLAAIVVGCSSGGSDKIEPSQKSPISSGTPGK